MSATPVAAVLGPAVRTGGRSALATATGAGLAGAMALVVISSRHAAPSAVSPVTPRGAWNDVWIGGLIAAFALYGLGAYLARSGQLRVQTALLVAVIVQSLPLAAPLLLSKDVFLYWGEARVMTSHHANPYVATPADYPADPALPWISESWRGQPTPYGPAWEVVGAAPAALPGTSARGAELAYRALAVAAMLACLAIVFARTRSAAAVAFLGWSPLLALHYGGGGHSDAVMMTVVLGAVAAGATLRAGALWPIASAFKPFPPILVPLELAQRRLAVTRRFWAGLLVSTATVAGAATALFGTHWIRAAATGAHQTSPLGGVHWATELGLPHRDAVILCAAVFLLFYCGLLRHAWIHRRARFSLAASALALTSSLLRPWYALWPVALAALEEDVLGAVVAYALTGYLLFGDAVSL